MADNQAGNAAPNPAQPTQHQAPSHGYHDRSRGMGRGGPRGPRRNDQREEGGFKETVVTINRVAKVVKGGKRFSFSALVVVGDAAGKVGYGMGKAKDVQAAILKGNSHARKALISFPIVPEGTIPHEIVAKFGSAKVW